MLFAFQNMHMKAFVTILRQRICIKVNEFQIWFWFVSLFDAMNEKNIFQIQNMLNKRQCNE